MRHEINLLEIIKSNQVMERGMEEVTMDGKSNSDRMESRRKFLKTAGKFAVYTPPAIILMSKPGSEVFAESGGGGVDEQPQTSSSSSCGDGGLAEGAIAELMCKLGM